MNFTTIVILNKGNPQVTLEEVVRRATAEAERLGKKPADHEAYVDAVTSPGILPAGQEGEVLIFPSAIFGPSSDRVRALQKNGAEWRQIFTCWLSYPANFPCTAVLLDK